MDQELKSYLDAMKAELRADMDAMKADLKVHVSEEFGKFGTRLISEFRNWDHTSDMRNRHPLGDIAVQ